jgi:DNA-binding IscR family transcriptional regulator
MLMDRELVVETNDEPSTYVLQSDPANMTVAEFLQIVRRPNDEQSMMNDQIQSVGGVDEVMAQLESSVGEKLAGLTLRKLVDDGKPD